MLDAAQTLEDLAIPLFRTHVLKNELARHWSIRVNGNWRVTFRFVDGEVELAITRTTTEEVSRMVMRNPVHPGEVLREDVLADLGLGVGEAASRLGVSRVTLSRVLHGHARVSPNLAVRLEQAGVGTARSWLAMQTAYDLAAETAAGVPKVRRLDEVA